MHPSVWNIANIFLYTCSDVQQATHKEKGWPNTAYGMSNLGQVLMSFVQQKALDSDTTRRDIVVNAVSIVGI